MIPDPIRAALERRMVRHDADALPLLIIDHAGAQYAAAPADVDVMMVDWHAVAADSVTSLIGPVVSDPIGTVGAYEVYAVQATPP